MSSKPCLMKLNGSATIEATFIIPAILMFFAAFIWLIDIFRIHSTVGAILNDTGKNMAVYSYAYEEVLSGNDSKELLSLIFDVGWSEICLRKKINDSPVADKLTKLTFSTCSVGEDDAIQIKAVYLVKPYIYVPGYVGFRLSNSFYCKAYFKNRVVADYSGNYVFVTKDSEVYHSEETCKSLNREVVTVPFSEIEKQRNQSRGKYYPCKYCDDKPIGENVFLTSQGSRYHTDEKCRELNITVYKIPIEEIGDRRKCLFCQ